MKLYKIFGLILLVLSHVIQAEVISMSTMQEVENKVMELVAHFPPQDTLAVFDIDMVLTQPSNPAFQMPNIQKNRAEIKVLLKGITPEQKDILLNLITKSSEPVLIEQDTPEIIKAIEAKKIKTMALTASLTGRLGKIKNFEAWRYEILKNLGIDFSNSFSQTPEIKFNDVPTYLGRKPVFYKGILCGNGEGNKNDKGDALVLFLEKVSFSPKVVVFVDDKKENLENVEQALVKFNPRLKYIGIEYKGGESTSSEDIDTKVVLHEWEKLFVEAKKIESKNE